jgi:hypothetical protein
VVRPCRAELPQFETMYRMYVRRAFGLVTVSINCPDEQAGVLKVLTEEHATSTNRILSSTDIYPQLAANIAAQSSTLREDFSC